MYFSNKWCSCCNIFYFRIVETGYYSEHKAAEALRQICEALDVSARNGLHSIRPWWENARPDGFAFKSTSIYISSVSFISCISFSFTPFLLNLISHSVPLPELHCKLFYPYLFLCN